MMVVMGMVVVMGMGTVLALALDCFHKSLAGITCTTTHILEVVR